MDKEDELLIEKTLNETIRENKELIDIIRKKAKKEVFVDIENLFKTGEYVGYNDLKKLHLE